MFLEDWENTDFAIKIRQDKIWCWYYGGGI